MARTLVMLWIVSALCCGLDFREKQSLSQLEQVIGILEQQGRLHEVDSDLLKRINVALDRDPAESEVQVQKISPVRPVTSARNAKQSFLQRARERQLALLGSKERESRGDRPRPRNNIAETRAQEKCSKLELEVRRLEIENRKMKKTIMNLEEELELGNSCDCGHSTSLEARAISNTDQNQFNPLQALLEAEQVNPLEALFDSAKAKDENVIVSSSLVTPVPIVSTIFSTISTVETVTVTHTTDLVVHYHGRAIPTQLLEEEEVTTTRTSTLTSTTEITPTPTWTYVTMTQTPAPTPSPPKEDLLQFKLEQLKVESISRPTPSLPIIPSITNNVGPRVKAEVVEIPRKLNNIQALQKYLEEVRKLSRDQIKTVRASEEDSPTVSVSTVYLSGSIPGEFSTSLVTVTRARRHAIHPNKSGDSRVHVSATKLYNPSGDTILDNDHNHVEIQGTIV